MKEGKSFCGRGDYLPKVYVESAYFEISTSGPIQPHLDNCPGGKRALTSTTGQ